MLTEGAGIRKRLVIISLTGLVLLFYLKRKRVSGLLVVLGGAVAAGAVIMFLAPGGVRTWLARRGPR